MSQTAHGSDILESEFLIYDRRAGKPHLRAALVFAAVLFLAALAAFPWRTDPLPRIVPFIPVIDTVHFIFCGISAAVLFSLASVMRSRALMALGGGYVFVGLTAAVHALTFPWTFSPTGLLGARPDTGTWLYLAWHTVLPLSIILYAVLKETPAPPQKHPLRAPARAILFCFGLAVAGAAAWTWAATAGIPPAFSDAVKLRYANDWHYLVTGLCAATIALLWRGRRSILDLCLMLTLWAWFLEYVLIFPGAARFSLGWYGGRLMGLVSGLFVLLMLLIEMSRLYARTVMLIAVQKRQRESRLMVGEAVGAFIAHELRQPLAALSLNAYTAQQLGAGMLRADNQLSEVLDDLMQDTRRASDIIENTRALSADMAGQKRPTDINQLVRDTLLMTSHELRNHHVQVALELDETLPPVEVNRMQMQQVFMNLFINAAEAMSAVTEDARRLTIRSARGEAGLFIQVADTGPSIGPADRDRIFEPFFTTKRHGAGMGLSICRSVVLAHGGAIRVAAGPPLGASFEIRLPDSRAGTAPALA